MTLVEPDALDGLFALVENKSQLLKLNLRSADTRCYDHYPLAA